MRDDAVRGRSASKTWLERLTGSHSPKYERPLKTTVGYLMQRTRRFDHVSIQRDGYELPFFAQSNVALTYWVVPDLVDPTEEFVRSLLGPGDVFVDVGANVGTVSALAGGVVGPTGRVLAIEPHPTTYGLLRRTIAANCLENVDCIDVACGAATGEATLTDEPRKDDNNKIVDGEDADHGDDDGPLAAGADATRAGIPVRTAPLADLLEEHGLDHVDLVKIDVEGFEAAVLRGLGGAFSKVGAFHVEVIERNLQRYGDATAAIITLLQEQGFACFEIPDDPTNLVAFSATGPDPSPALSERLIAIPDGSATG